MFAEIIKRERTKKAISQRELGDIVSVTQQAVGRWETGQALPDTGTLSKLADFFGVSTDYLLGKTDSASTTTKKPQDLKKILEQHEIMFDGVPIDEESKEDILHIIEFELYKKAKEMNKRKKKE